MHQQHTKTDSVYPRGRNDHHDGHRRANNVYFSQLWTFFLNNLSIILSIFWYNFSIKRDIKWQSETVTNFNSSCCRDTHIMTNDSCHGCSCHYGFIKTLLQWQQNEDMTSFSHHNVSFWKFDFDTFLWLNFFLKMYSINNVLFGVLKHIFFILWKKTSLSFVLIFLL